MPRANRHYIPGYVWHITHRCHKKEFLLEFGRDRRRWIEWLFQAKKRHGLSTLNYMVTSSHIHLMVSDNGDRDTIPKSIQLIAGRTWRGVKSAFDSCFIFCQADPMSTSLRIQYSNASSERLAMAGRGSTIEKKY